ncbi:E6 [Leptonychotes weddellii papillomavirus 1]|uniref:Protein E6 n=1 Tax=Leptonychotes weddellii papillomavirus 1 TaxID=2077302 RepID=A0A2I8B2N2_9PAPI|nr:E6 [Leptonychotes weddellii papillomavirus 1]AUT11895.1 E6 [Leptonychotes weddellii papillomavirus 1]
MERPSSVKGLCALIHSPLIDLLLPCKFCHRYLTTLEKLRFDAAPFQLIWKEGNVYGCCQTCIRHCGLIERNYFLQGKIDAFLFEEKLGKKVEELTLRCSFCLHTLTYWEKKENKFDSALFLVRGKVRGTCDLCRLQYAWGEGNAS